MTQPPHKALPPERLALAIKWGRAFMAWDEKANLVEGRYAWAGIVPKFADDPHGNRGGEGLVKYREHLEFRRACLDLCEHFGECWRIFFRRICEQDIVFWLNAFVWTLDPRLPKGSPPKPATIPFITYKFQDYVFATLDQSGENQQHHAVEKSRDMGATWIVMARFTHSLLYKKRFSAIVSSKIEPLVDGSNNSDTLMGKLDFIIEHLPGFLRGNVLSRHLFRTNTENGSQIRGEATTPDLGRSGRASEVLLDEFGKNPFQAEIRAAIANVTDSALYISTHDGPGTEFNKMIKEKQVASTRLHWSLHPEHGRGLYKSTNGKLEVLDDTYSFPVDYPFILDGKTRSPWYDKKCREIGSDMLVAQELDINPEGSAAQFFEQELIDDQRSRFARLPIWQGDVIIDPESHMVLDLIERKDGPLRLWIRPDDLGKLAYRRWAAGADISQGTGKSDSVLAFGDQETGEKLGEFVVNRLGPNDFADYCFGILHWLGDDVPLLPETNGPGQDFIARLLANGYTRINRQKVDKAPSVDQKISAVYGWWSSAPAKKRLLFEYKMAMRDGFYCSHSTEEFEQCLEYIWDGPERVLHSKSKNKLDPRDGGENHGDRVIASALFFRLCAGVVARAEAESKVPPPFSLGARRPHLLARANGQTVRPEQNYRTPVLLRQDNPKGAWN